MAKMMTYSWSEENQILRSADQKAFSKEPVFNKQFFLMQESMTPMQKDLHVS
jgi:hypothetical protein